MATIKEVKLNDHSDGGSDNPLEEAVVVQVRDLIGSDVLTLTEYVIPDGEEDVSIQLFSSGMEEETVDEPIIISTFGAGAIKTKGEIQIDEKKVPYRAEFYALTETKEESILLGQALSQLAFIVYKNEQMFAPGMIVAGVLPVGLERFTHLYLTPAPLGKHKEIAISPLIAGEEFAIMWVNAFPITEAEAEAINTSDESNTKFVNFIEGLGNKAYSLEREIFAA